MKRMKKTVASILTAVVALSAVGFAGCSEEDMKNALNDVKTSVSDFIDGSTESNAEEKPSVEDYDGTIVQDGETYPMLKAMAFTAPQAQATSTETETFTPVSVDLKATVEPSDANQNVVWSVEFVNSSSSWANGKNISEYMQVTQSLSSVSTGTVTCLKPFGEQIKITATSAENADISASCTVDFVQSVKSVSLSYGEDLSINLGGITNVTWEVNYYGIGMGGDRKIAVEYYDDYTIYRPLGERVKLVSPSLYLNGENSTTWGKGIYSKESYNDGYFVLNGTDCGLCSHYDTDSDLFDLDYFQIDNSHFNKCKPRTSSSSSSGILLTNIDKISTEDLISNYLCKIDNGYLYTLVLELVDYNSGEQVFPIVYTSLSLINLVGYTNVARVQSISLESDSLTF